MDYDFIEAVEKRYNNIMSLGGETEKSYWQNVGKIVNKKEFLEKQDSVFDTIMKNTNRIVYGEKK